MHVWDHREAVSWSLVAAGVAGYALLFAGAYFGWGGMRGVFASYGVGMLAGTVVLAIIAGGVTWEKRANPTVHLVGDAAQSHWERTTGPGGETGTALHFQMQATNISRGPIRVSLACLLRPRVGNPEVDVKTRDPLTNQFGDAPPMEPNETRDIRFTFNVDGPIGRPGKALSAVVAVSDHLGRAHKFKFKRIQPISERPSKAG